MGDELGDVSLFRAEGRQESCSPCREGSRAWGLCLPSLSFLWVCFQCLPWNILENRVFSSYFQRTFLVSAFWLPATGFPYRRAPPASLSNFKELLVDFSVVG